MLFRSPDGGLVTIKDRKNGGVRFLAVVCPEGQIAQCRGDHFGGLQATIDRLKPLAEKYVTGICDRVQVKKELEAIKQEAKQEAKQGTIKQEAIKQGAIKQEAIKQEATKQEATEQEAIKQEAPQRNKRKRTATPIFADEDELPFPLDELY